VLDPAVGQRWPGGHPGRAEIGAEFPPKAIPRLVGRHVPGPAGSRHANGLGQTPPELQVAAHGPHRLGTMSGPPHGHLSHISTSATGRSGATPTRTPSPRWPTGSFPSTACPPPAPPAAKRRSFPPPRPLAPTR